MPRSIRVLIVEDHIPDAELMVHELHWAGFEPEWQRVQDKTHYLAQLDTLPDIILADHTLPLFSAAQALDLLKQRGLDIPFIVVTGTLTEETAVKHIKKGAADYILKDRMARLGAAVTGALEEKRLREERRQAEESLQARYQELRTLHEIGRITLESPDIKAIMEEVLPKVVSIGSFDIGAISLLDSSSGMLKMVASHGYRNSPDMERQPRDPKAGRRRHTVLMQKETGIMENIGDERGMRTYKREGVQSAILIPVRVGDDVMGLIRLGSRTPRKFEPSQVHLLETIGNQMGVAIQKARLYEEVRRKVQDLEQKTVQLERANRVKDEFLSVMSHELRTPLTAVIGYAGMLQDGVLGKINPDQERACCKIIRHIEELLSMVTGILYTTSLEAKAVNVAKQPVDLAALLNEFRSAYDASLAKELALIWDFPAEFPPLSTDGAKLKQILQNLIDNAIKFTERGSVTVSAHAGKSHVKFKVADTGIGIPKEMLSAIFDKFKQVDSSETRIYGGVGLGLYVAKQFTEMLGGAVTVESEIGNGSTFTVAIPC